MKDAEIKYQFKAKVWQYEGPSAWYFVSLPNKLSREIRNAMGKEEEGWGRLKVIARLGECEWKTAIWYDTKGNTYLLPLKAEIRLRGNIIVGNKVKIDLCI